MTERAKKYLIDLLLAIDLIEQFTTDIQSFEAYQADLKTKSAVERQLGIVGEAVNQFRKIESKHTLDHSRAIVNFRNRLIHAYDNIDDAIVWAIMIRHLPELKQEVKALIG